MFALVIHIREPLSRPKFYWVSSTRTKSHRLRRLVWQYCACDRAEILTAWFSENCPVLVFDPNNRNQTE